MKYRPIKNWLLVEPLTQAEVVAVERGKKSASLLVFPGEAKRRPGKAPKFERWCRVFALPTEHDSGLRVGDVVYCDVMQGSHGPDAKYTKIEGRDVFQMPIADVMVAL